MSLKIVSISDTHEKHRQLIIPECDILIHSGDCTNRGSLLKLYDFCTWIAQQPARHKVLVYGNHELGFSSGSKRQEAVDTPKQFGINYLENSEIVIDGIKIYGSPITPFYFDWEWNVNRGSEIAKVWSQIPNDTNILITHGPPHGILDLVEEDFCETDQHQGCEELRKKVDQLSNLKLHVFGHLHGNNQLIELNNKIFINAAMVDDKHRIIREPVVIDL